MEDDERVVLFIAASMPVDDREGLLASIRAWAGLEPVEAYGVNAEWDLFVAIFKDIGAVAGGISAAAKLAKEILAWRKRLRSRKREVKVRMQRPGAPVLDLEEASDEEVLEWFRLTSGGPPRPRVE